MGVFQVKKYKTIKDENENKKQVSKTKEEWNRETCGGTKIYYFSDRYEINNKTKQYKSGVFALKREAEAEERLFLTDPIAYILEHSKRAKKSLEIAKIKELDKSNDKSLNEYFIDFLNKRYSRIKEGCVYDNKNDWETQMSEHFGDKLPSEVTLELTQEWYDKIDTKINPKSGNLYKAQTKNNWRSLLIKFFDFLHNKGKMPINYARVIESFKDVTINKNAKKKIKYQTEEQFNLFMSVVDDNFWYTFFNFLFWHGCRKGEQRAIKIKDIMLKHDAITFNKTFARSRTGGEIIGPIKNGKERTIFLASQSKPYVEKLIELYKYMDGYNDEWFLFGGPINTGKNRIERALTHYYDKLEEKYPDKKINRLTHHEFGRHSHASYLLEEGLKKGMSSDETYAMIAQRLGDTIDVIKQTYAHPYDDANNDKAKEILKF